MNPTLRRVLTAGLGSLAMTDKAVRRLVDDLVSKGDITRSEGERLLCDLERKWEVESGRFGKQLVKTREKFGRLIAGVVSDAINRAGLARKSEFDALRRKLNERQARKGRSAPAAGRVSGRRRRGKSASDKANSS
jgi:polyhydroxyalkanoate synthesis regulator phasin